MHLSQDAETMMIKDEESKSGVLRQHPRLHASFPLLLNGGGAVAAASSIFKAKKLSRRWMCFVPTFSCPSLRSAAAAAAQSGSAAEFTPPEEGDARRTTRNACV